MGLTTLLQYVV